MWKEASPRTIYLKDYQPVPWVIRTVDLDFRLHEKGTRVISRLTLERNPAFTGQAAELRLDGEGLKPVWLRLDGSELHGDAYGIDDQGLVLFNPPEQFVLESEVELAPEKNTTLQGLYRSGSMFCTQCEAEGFRHITWYLDRPDVMARFKVRLEADRDKYPVLLSNGNPLERGELPDNRHYAEWEDPHPKPSYLFALVAGKLKYIEDSFETASGRPVRLRIYVEPENIDKCDHAMQSLIRSMRWDEEKYGREYDLDVFNIVAVNDFNMGAMENKGLNIFNSKYVLARPDTATDDDYLGIEAVIAHEYFHNWTGNRITCRDWFQLSLKEGFTVYRDQEFSSDMGARGIKRIDDVRMLRAHQFAEDDSPMAHPVRPASYMEINNFYTVTVYEKGAEVVRMQANLLGPELFRKATDIYFDRFDGQAVTTDDFVRCMEDASGRDLTQFRHWYDYAGTPELTVQGEYHPDEQVYRLQVRQSVPDTPGQKNKPPFHIPLVVGLLDSHGRDMPLDRSDGSARPELLEVMEKEQTFEFRNLPEAPVPSLLRGFSAPVKLNYPYSDAELVFLMAHDSDGFNRWDAGQELAQRVLLKLVEQAPEGADMLAEFTHAFHRALDAAHSDPALLSEVLSLPSESLLGERMEVVDVEGIHAAREQVKAHIGKRLHDDLLSHYRDLGEEGEYQVTPETIGRRRLKNLLLTYLTASGSREAVDLCVQQYQAGHNMTDVIHALTLVADGDHPARQELLDDFAARWHADPLVMDKWFSVQARSSRKDTLERVMALQEHPAFSITNPNKVRALIGSFAMGNPFCFHSADGKGYTFLVDKVLQLDGINPQIAARLLRSMARWRHYDKARRELARGQLERVAGQNGISRDVYEVASKSLQG
ncbi:aminopeptidase N [Thiolapillus brandeum]|uniref:Aminopeptidase N n=1 Tax=Thiolapillus brandeum TaxID=1076588 RepID=A0A7U6JJ51_9GAMM|nr:aminopeptidase N [Thiolapillus brandeum]BAO45353.1 aminopeptidase N [Thiolapillus brandeum]